MKNVQSSQRPQHGSTILARALLETFVFQCTRVDQNLGTSVRDITMDFKNSR